MIFLSFFIVPILLLVAAYIWFGKRITLKELLLQVGLQALVVGCICGIIYFKNTGDTETWSGRVTGKSRDVVMCEHSYRCNCHDVCSGSGESRSCHEVCSTCYEHTYDVDWNVRTTNGEGVEISRVDRQGTTEPSRWTAVKIGEPTALPHHYTNYIKAAPDSIFRGRGEIKEALPAYPQGYYDYYRLNRLVQVGVSLPDVADWEKDLSELNADLGRKKEANIVLVLVRDKSREWFKTLELGWLGGKKNDVIIVIGSGSDSSISWVEAMAWTDRAHIKVALRDELQGIGKLNRGEVISAIRANVDKYFVRKPMSDFSYLMSSTTPSGMEYAFGLIFSIMAAIGLAWWCSEKDVFDEEPKNRLWYR